MQILYVIDIANQSSIRIALKNKFYHQIDNHLQKFPKVFISYCWSNSHSAIEKGSREIDGALGWADPRQVKTYLEQYDIPCWLDVEQAGTTGLFQDITQGIKRAQVFLAFVSDEVSIVSINDNHPKA